MRKFLPVALSGAMAVSFSTLAFAQGSATTTTDKQDNVHYNIHQRGDQNTSQSGSGNQSSQVLGSDNQTSQTQQQGAGNSSMTTTQSGDASASAGASTDDDDKRKNKKEHANKGWHKGWDNPASSGSTKY